MNAKHKGTRAEHHIKLILETAGYAVAGAAASLGNWNLIGVSATHVVPVHVKSNVFHVNGRPIGEFRKSWQRACLAVGLGRPVPTGQVTPKGKPKLRYTGLIPHDLRRSAVPNMVRAGIPERVCMALSGHKTRAIFDRYNIVSESDLTSAAERLHQHLQEQRTSARVAAVGGADTAATQGTRTEHGQITPMRKRAVA